MTSPLEFNTTPGRPEPVPPPTAEGQGTPGKPGEFEAGLQSGWSTIDMQGVLDAANTISPPAARSATPAAVDKASGETYSSETASSGTASPGTKARQAVAQAASAAGGTAHERMASLQADLDSGRIDQQTFMMRLVGLQMEMQTVAFRTELTVKLVDQVTAGVNKVLNTNA